MLKPRMTERETERLTSLYRTGLLYSPADERFDRLTRIARLVFGVEHSALSLIDAELQWFKSIQGLDVCETSREVSFCGHAIHGSGVFLVPDARADDRFHDNPLVTGEPEIAFYAGCPVQGPDGHSIGVLCVFGSEALHPSTAQLEALEDLGAIANQEIALHCASEGEAHDAPHLINVDVPFTNPESRVVGRQAVLEALEAQVHLASSQGQSVSTAVLEFGSAPQVDGSGDPDFDDSVVRMVAKRLVRQLRGCDVLGRLNAHEFMVIFGDGAGPSEAKAIAEAIHSACRGNGGVSVPGASTLRIGVAVTPSEHGAARALAVADTARGRADPSTLPIVVIDESPASAKAA